MAENKNWASIIPLDYSTPDQVRLEFNVGFLSTDWESLQELLARPEAFLLTRQALWPQQNEHPERVGQTVEWTMLSPISMHIAPAKGSLPAVIKSARSLGVSVSDAKSEAAGQAEATQSVAKMAEILAKRVSELAPGGAFLVEFAPHTHVLKIFYWPPHPCAQATAASAADPTGEVPAGRLNEPYTKATLGLIGETEVAGTLHFDLGKGNDVRARFIMDHIENSGRTCQKLNTEFPELFLVHTEFIPEGETIIVRELGSQTHKPINILQTPASAPTAAIDPRAPSVRLTDDLTAAPDVTFPSITVDGVTPDDPCYICTLVDVTDTPSAFVIGNMDIKIYCPGNGNGTANSTHP